MARNFRTEISVIILTFPLLFQGGYVAQILTFIFLEEGSRKEEGEGNIRKRRKWKQAISFWGFDKEVEHIIVLIWLEILIPTWQSLALLKFFLAGEKIL